MAGKVGMQPTKPRSIPEQFAPGFLMATDRRYKPAIIVAQQLAELHETLGGASELTPQKRSLCERAVWLNMRLQQMEQQYLAGQGLDASEYTTLIGSLTSVYRLLGINRQARRLPRALEYAAKVAGNGQEAPAP